MIDGCAISLPAHRDGEVPVGLMLASTGGNDRSLFELAAGIEGAHPCLTSTFTIDAQGTTTPLTLAIDQAVIAGWTGRDPVARDKHIAELEALGIARPASTPIYYRVAARRLTTADSIEVSGGDSSGEVEFVLIGWQGRIFVGCRLRPHRPQGRELRRHRLQADVRQADRAGAVGARRRHRPLGPDDPALVRHRSMARACCIRRARSMPCCR